MTRASRRVLRGAIAACALAGITFVALEAIRQRRTPDVRPATAPDVDQWAIKRLDYVHYAAEALQLRIRAKEARLDRIRVGPFRLGFAHRLVLRGARIDASAHPARGEGHHRISPSQGRRPPVRRRRAIADVHIEGLVIRLRGPQGRRFHLAARQCDANVAVSGRVLLTDVRIQAGDVDRRLELLAYDPGRRRFVAGRMPEGESGAGGHAITNQVLTDINLVLRDLGNLDITSVASGITDALAGG